MLAANVTNPLGTFAYIRHRRGTHRAASACGLAGHPRRGLRPKREGRRPQTFDVNVMQERGEPRFLVRLRHSAHTIQPTERALPGSVSGMDRVWLAAFPLPGSAFLHRLASAAPPWALFGRLSGTTRPSDFSRSSITGLPPWRSPRDPPLDRDRRVIMRSPGSQHEEITRMHGFFDPAGSDDGSRKRRHRCCLPLIHSTSALR